MPPAVDSASETREARENGEYTLDSLDRVLSKVTMLEKAPCAKRKIDELLFQFLATPANQERVRAMVQDLKDGVQLPEFPLPQPIVKSPRISSPRRQGALHGQVIASSPPRSPRSPGTGHFLSPRSATSPSSPLVVKTSFLRSTPSRSPVSRSPASHSPARTPRPKPLPKETPAFVIPPFHGVDPFPDEDDTLLRAEIDRYFGAEDKLSISDMDVVCKDLCGFPGFFAIPLCRRIQQLWAEDSPETCSASQGQGKQADTAWISKKQFLKFYEKELVPYDDLDRFFRLVKRPENEMIESADFFPFIEELLQTHPGLDFLANTPEFQEKYARTVIARIVYENSALWTGKITRRELRLSDLLNVCHQVDEEDDINQVLRYFSYEHFYTIYVKFWELDRDHDFFLSKEDLLRHDGHAITPAIVDRIFEQPAYTFFSGKPDLMSYEDFCFFFLSEEDKTNARSLRYWFSCVDIDGDGVIRSWELRHFYDIQLARIQSYGQEVIAFADIVCQAHDFVNPQIEGEFRLNDFCNPAVMHISGMLFNMLFNLNKFVAFESRDQYYVKQLHENPELTEWDRYAAGEYARFASAEEEREMEEENFAAWGEQQQQRHEHDDNDRNWLHYE